MNRPPYNPRPIRLAAAAAALALASCARYRGGPVAGPEDVETPPETHPVLSASGPPLNIRPAPIARVEAAPENPPDPLPSEVVAIPGDPPTATEPAGARPAGAPVLVEAKVGEINAMPVYASRILDETGIGAELARIARKPGISLADWRQTAGELVAHALRRLVQDELIESEARDSLTAPQRVGLRAMTEQRAQTARRRSGGTQSGLERLLQSEGHTYEEFLRDQEARTLIAHGLERKVDSRVFVTTRDLTRYYERNWKEYNRDPVARFRIIRVSAADDAAIESVRAALERGEPFETIAALPINTLNPEGGGVEEKPFTGEYARAEFFGSLDEMNAAARALSPGAITPEPVNWGSFKAWIRLDAIKEVRRPLTDESVQLEILAILSERKRQELLDKHVMGLIDRAGLTGQIGAMRLRLVWIAERRYWDTRATE